MNEKVVIGLPVYNGSEHLEEALESLARQGHEKIEIYVVDNASTDATPEIARRFARGDKRIHCIRHSQPVSAMQNWQRTFEIASPGSCYFMWASDDDLWAEDYVESLLPALRDNPKTVLSFSQVDVIDGQGRFVSALYRKKPPQGKTALGRIGALIRNGRYSAIYGIMRTSAIDWRPCLAETSFGYDLWFLIRMAARGEFSMVPRPLFKKRLGGISTTGGDPSAALDPNKIWRLDDQDRAIIDTLPLNAAAKRWVYYRLKVQAKVTFPEHKKTNWMLLPFATFYLLRNNPRALGIRSGIRARLQLNHPTE